MRLVCAVIAGLLLLAAPASARDEVVRSFDGTELHISFFPAKTGKRAPTILMTHGWPGRRERTPNAALTARSASSPKATGAPKTAITASPMNFSTMPPTRWISSRTRLW